MDSASDNPFSPNRKSESLEVHLLGIVDFDAAMLLQKHLVYEISGRNDRFGTLLICEHPPLITIGREGSRSDVLADEQELTSRNLDVRWMNRGGGAVVHGPGQLAVYPILPLDRLGCGLGDYRERLRTAVAEMCRELRVPTWNTGGAQVWHVQTNGMGVADAQKHSTTPFVPQERATRDAVASPGTGGVPGIGCRCGQFAFLGAAVKSWVSYHGMFVNVAPCLELMRLARSGCGMRVTSLAAQRVRHTPMHSVREALVRHLAEQFGYRQFHIHTGHPLLKRERREVYVHA